MHDKNICISIAVIIVIFSPFFLFDVAVAHRVNIFAWIEGDTVFTKSKFPGGREVKGGKIVVMDSRGNELLTGRTDHKGEFSFKVPGRMDLRIVLVAGQGHQADWVLHAADMDAASSEEKSDAKVEETAQVERTTIESKNKGTESAAPASEIEKGKLEAVIESVLDRKLKPIYAMLAEIRQEGPSVKDIFAGIGYILGLVGIAAYVHSRKKKE